MLVQTSPSKTEQFSVVLNFFRYIGKSNAFVIVNDEVTQGLALEFFSGVRAHPVTVIKIDTSSLVHIEISKNLLRIKSSNVQSIFLHCERKFAHLMLWLAKDFGLINDEYTWIVSDRIVQSFSDLLPLPSSIYGVRANLPPKREDRLAQSLYLIQRTFETIPSDVIPQYLGKHLDCYGTETWTKGEELYE